MLLDLVSGVSRRSCTWWLWSVTSGVWCSDVARGGGGGVRGEGGSRRGLESSGATARGTNANSANVLGLWQRGRQTCVMVRKWAGRE